MTTNQIEILGENGEALTREDIDRMVANADQFGRPKNAEVLEGTLVTTDSTKEEARARVDRIKVSATNLLDDLIAAYRQRDWIALGYANWDELRKAEFDSVMIPKARRAEEILTMRQAGMSTRAIASVADTSEATVRREIAKVTATNAAVTLPGTTLSEDGRERPAKKRPAKKKTEPETIPPKKVSKTEQARLDREAKEKDRQKEIDRALKTIGQAIEKAKTETLVLRSALGRGTLTEQQAEALRVASWEADNLVNATSEVFGVAEERRQKAQVKVAEQAAKVEAEKDPKQAFAEAHPEGVWMEGGEYLMPKGTVTPAIRKEAKQAGVRVTTSGVGHRPAVIRDTQQEAEVAASVASCHARATRLTAIADTLAAPSAEQTASLLAGLGVKGKNAADVIALAKKGA